MRAPVEKWKGKGIKSTAYTLSYPSISTQGQACTLLITSFLPCFSRFAPTKAYKLHPAAAKSTSLSSPSAAEKTRSLEIWLAQCKTRRLLWSSFCPGTFRCSRQDDKFKASDTVDTHHRSCTLKFAKGLDGLFLRWTTMTNIVYSDCMRSCCFLIGTPCIKSPCGSPTR